MHESNDAPIAGAFFALLGYVLGWAWATVLIWLPWVAWSMLPTPVEIWGVDLLAGAVGLVILWVQWRHRDRLIRRVRRLRLTRKIARFLAGTPLWGEGTTPWVRLQAGTALGTWRVTVDTPDYATDSQVQALDDAVAAHLRAYVVEGIRPGISSRAGTVEFAIALTEGPLQAESVPEMSYGELTADAWTMPIGLDALGEQRDVTLWTAGAGAARCLVTGASGTGKSSATVRLTAAALEHGLDTYVYDPDSTSVRGLHSRCTIAATTPREGLEMARQVKQIVADRNTRLAMGETPAPGIVVFEELQNLLQSDDLDRKEQAELRGLIGYFSREIRKSGLVFVIASQDTAGEAYGGTSVRDQMNVIFAFPLPESKAALILDETGSELCSRLREAPPGVCVVRDDTAPSTIPTATGVRMPRELPPPISAPTVEDMVTDVLTSVDIPQEAHDDRA